MRLSVIGVLCIVVIAGMKAVEWGERRAFGANQIMGITLVEDESVLEDGEVVCPNCGEKLEFDLKSLEEEEEEGE